MSLVHASSAWIGLVCPGHCRSQSHRRAGRPILKAQEADEAAETVKIPQIQPEAGREAAPAARGSQYYAGMLRSDIRTTNDASAADMLTRSLQLAGGMALLLALLTYGFLASNGLA